MTPARFPEANTKLLGGQPDVEDLPAYKDGQQIISAWRLSWRERLSALVFGRLWLFVMSPDTHPPIALSVERTVFERTVSS